MDLKQFQPTPSYEHSSIDNVTTILSVGRFREKKGFPHLLHACHLLKERGHRLRCHIVGYGPLQEEIDRLITDLELDGIVSLHGKLTHDELIELYRKSTIFALPCQIAEDGDRDGIPNSLLEAMAMKIPVISTNVSGIPELIEHMKNGIIVPPKDSKSLASAIKLLIDQPHLRRELGKAGHHKVCQQFSLERNIFKLKELFESALNSL